MLPPRNGAPPRAGGLRTTLAIGLVCGIANGTSAADLVEGSLVDEENQPLEFSISAEAKDKLVGGAIILGGHEYRIVGESRYGLVGASRVEGAELAAKNRVGEYLVFSSSYSEQTATGDPWVHSDRYIGCDQPYNSFLARYRVLGQAKVDRLGPKPFGELIDGVLEPDDASVYCFTSTRAD